MLTIRNDFIYWFMRLSIDEQKMILNIVNTAKGDYNKKYDLARYLVINGYFPTVPHAMQIVISLVNHLKPTRLNVWYALNGEV